MKKQNRFNKRNRKSGIKVLFNDDSLVILNKPAGYLSQADSSGDPDMLNWCAQFLRQSHAVGSESVHLLHRLDRPVPGVMIFAKNPGVAGKMTEQFRKRTAKKIYHAVVHGTLPISGQMEDYLRKNPERKTSEIVLKDAPEAKLARLTYSVIDYHSGRSLVEINLETGRSHQIRIQFSSRGHPIVADRKYGSREVLRDPGMIALWARSITFQHPILKKRITVEAPRPPYWPWYYRK